MPVRSILKGRLEWLQREIGSNANQAAETSSVWAPLADIDVSLIDVRGQFFAGSLPFESAAAKLITPGAYALLVRNPSSKSANEDCSEPLKQRCGSYLAQWFLNTDIGLSFYEGEKDFTVIARSLHSGAAKANAKIELISAGNRVLGTGTTDEFGVAKFERRLTQGTLSNALVAIMAQRGDPVQHLDDFAFLAFGSERLDLSRLNVDGRALTHGLSAFLTTDRGIYRPGETANLVMLVRNGAGIAPDVFPPAIVKLEARDRVVVQKRVDSSNWKIGGIAMPVEIPSTIRPGSARIVLTLGEADEAPVVGETIIEIGAVKPDRARLRFLDPNDGWRASKTADGFVNINGRLNAQYLYVSAGTKNKGAAHDLKAEVIVKIAPAATPVTGCFANFVFGRFNDKTVQNTTRQFYANTDAAGNLTLSLAGIPITDLTRPMAATVETTLFDPAGPLASHSETLPIVDDGGWIGISKIPRLRPSAVPGMFDLDVNIVSVGTTGPGHHRFEFQLARERDVFAWQQRDGAWQHVRDVRTEKIELTQSTFESDKLSLTSTDSPTAGEANCAKAFRVQDLARGLNVGRYALTVTDLGNGRQSSVRFFAGSASVDANQLEPNIFTLSTDKEVYRPNEQIKLTADVAFDGELLVAFADGDVRHWATAQTKNGTATLTLNASPDMVGKGIYALATVFRANSDSSKNAGPERAIGLAYFEVKGEQVAYKVDLHLIDQRGARLPMAAGASIPFGSNLSFEVCIADQAGCSGNPPQDAFATAFVVDEGLLGLTGRQEQTPNPEKHFYGRRRFALRIMDNYDRLLLKEGGDRPNSSPSQQLHLEAHGRRDARSDQARERQGYHHDSQA